MIRHAVDNKLTIIIPTYNCRDYVMEAVDSVRFAGDKNCEIIIVDDGSTDGTCDILSTISDEVRIFFCEHKGASGARNYGMEKATGSHIAFLDCDDVLKEDFLKKGLPLINDNYDLVIFGFDNIDIYGKCSEAVLEDRTYPHVSDFADEYIRNRHLLIYSACNKIYRRDLIIEHNVRFRRELCFGEDRLFNYDYLKVCKSILTSSVKMFDYMHRSPCSASNRFMPDDVESVRMLHEAKMDCFLGLSSAVSEDEKRSFIYYDLTTEIARMKS